MEFKGTELIVGLLVAVKSMYKEKRINYEALKEITSYISELESELEDRTLEIESIEGNRKHFMEFRGTELIADLLVAVKYVYSNDKQIPYEELEKKVSDIGNYICELESELEDRTFEVEDLKDEIRHMEQVQEDNRDYKGRFKLGYKSIY